MISKAISDYLKESGIKQTHLSEKTGLSVNSVCTALNGKRKLSIDEYALICQALSLSYDYFFKRAYPNN